jgi:hypothetical protein
MIATPANIIAALVLSLLVMMGIMQYVIHLEWQACLVKGGDPVIIENSVVCYDKGVVFQ